MSDNDFFCEAAAEWDHDWEERPDGSLECRDCPKVVPAPAAADPDRDPRPVPEVEHGRSFKAPDGSWQWTCIRCAAHSGQLSWPTKTLANDAAWAHDAQCPTGDGWR